MLEADKQIILDHFDKQLRRYNADDPQAVSWNSKESQQTRFRALADIGITPATSVLDVGCGLGDLCNYLISAGKQGSYDTHYTGIDINPKMIDLAKMRCHDISAHFEVRDILDGEWEERFDYVVASGIFSLEMPDWEQVTWNMIRAMFKLCKVGVTVNFLSTWTPREKVTGMCYASPCGILRRAVLRVTKKVTLRHDYRANDFTVYLYR